MRSSVRQARLNFRRRPSSKLLNWTARYPRLEQNAVGGSWGADQENVHLVRKASPHLGLL